MTDPHRERPALRIAADVGEILLKQCAALGGGSQQPVHPAPGLGVVILRHLAGRGERLETVQIGLPGALEQATREMGHVAAVEAVIAPRRLEELGDSLVEPERHRGHDGVHVAVRGLVPEILGDPVLPGGEHRERGVGLDEKRPPRREGRKAAGHEGVVPGGVFEQVEVHRLVGHRQPEFLAHVGSQAVELADEPMLAGEREVGMNDQLPGGHFTAVRQPIAGRDHRRRDGGRRGGEGHRREVGAAAGGHQGTACPRCHGDRDSRHVARVRKRPTGVNRGRRRVAAGRREGRPPAPPATRVGRAPPSPPCGWRPRRCHRAGRSRAE